MRVDSVVGAIFICLALTAMSSCAELRNSQISPPTYNPVPGTVQPQPVQLERLPEDDIESIRIFHDSAKLTRQAEAAFMREFNDPRTVPEVWLSKSNSRLLEMEVGSLNMRAMADCIHHPAVKSLYVRAALNYTQRAHAAKRLRDALAMRDVRGAEGAVAEIRALGSEAQSLENEGSQLWLRFADRAELQRKLNASR